MVGNSNVSERAQKVSPHFQSYVNLCVKTKKVPALESYEIVSEHLKDKFLCAKLTFFQILSSELEPFLREFQSDKSLAPFLYTSLTTVIKTVMNRFVKPDVLKKHSVLNIDVTIDDNLSTANEINVGYATKHVLDTMDKKDVSKRDILLFKNECRTCLKLFVIKMMKKSPLHFSLTKGISCIDPSIAGSSLAVKRLDNTIEAFIASKIISGIEGDKIARQYKDFCSNKDVHKNFPEYYRKKDRFDMFWIKMLNAYGLQDSSNLENFVKIILTLSHGNAALERGFSINKECITHN